MAEEHWLIADTIPPQYTPQGRRLSTRGVIAGLVAAVLLGIALTLQWRGWGAVASESGGRCGGRYGRSCPQGSTAILVLSMLALFPLIPLTLVAIFGRLRRRDAVGRIVAVLTLAAIAVGVWPGNVIYGWAHGPVLTTVWTAPPEPDSRLSGQGSWLLPGAVVRARPDRLVSYDLATGRIRFTYTVPDPQLLCAMSRTTAAGVGLIAYGSESGPCRHVVALDLASGRELWHQDLPEEGMPTGTAKDFVSVSGGVAVVAAAATTARSLGGRQGLQAFDLRTGAARWHRELGGTCTVQAVGGQVTAIVECVTTPSATSVASGASSRITYAVHGLDPATGRDVWQTPVPYQAANANVDALSYDPLVLHVRETTTRGTDRLLSLDPTGHIKASIDAGSAGSSATLDMSTGGSAVLPTPSYAITHDLLLVQSRAAVGYRRAIEAYALADGHRVWSHSLGHDSLQALTVDGDRLIALTETGFKETLTSYRISDGARRTIGLVRLDLFTAQASLFSQNGTYAIVDSNGNTYPPIAALR